MLLTVPFSCERIDDAAFRTIRLRTIFECGKWDPQVGDSASLSPCVTVLREEAWSEIAAAAEAMAVEMLEAERELRERPELWRRLGLPRGVRAGLAAAQRFVHDRVACNNDSIRVVRFDFHFTSEGWRISEANSDVPGGFIEASGFTRLVAEHFDDHATAGDPAEELASAFANRVRPGALAALVHATAYTDDRQVMLYLSRALERVGLKARVVGPDCIAWKFDGADRRPRVALGETVEGIDAIIRFFPGEWLPNLPRRAGWKGLFRDDGVPISNPATALLTQSKRFPLVWNQLETPMPTWRRYLPETIAASSGRLQDSEWVTKPALGRVGEAIGMAGMTSQKDWKNIRRAVRRRPREWIAQRRFDMLPIQTPEGQKYPCVGVFVIAGSACGIYGRVSNTPLIDQHASDMAVLVESAKAHGHEGLRRAQSSRTKKRSGREERILAPAGTL